MILDKSNLFSEDQAITVTANSTNVIDLGSADDMGPGTVKEIWIQATEAFTADGAATLTVSLTTDDSAAMSSATTLYTSAAIGKASLVAGYKIPIRGLPTGAERYLRLTYTVATGPMTAGKISAGIVNARQENVNF